jgi:hypothetical protein
MPDLLDFYRELRPDCEGRMFSEILSWNDDGLEAVHDFIQWLFPLPEASRFNPDAPLLTSDDIAAFHREPRLQANLARSFDRILCFLGLQRTDDKVAEGPTFEHRRRNVWDCPNHNWLRISRILRSLTLLGRDREALMLFDWVEKEYLRRRFPIPSETYAFWKTAVGKVN